MPSACAAIPIRPPSSVPIATRSPCPLRGAGGRADPRALDCEVEVDEELRPSFSSSRVTRTWSPSRMNAETPFAPGVSGSVRANSSTVPAKLPFVIHCFVPEMDQPSPSATAAVLQRARIRARFRLGQGKRADALTARERRHEAARCSSVPKARIGKVTALVCTATVTPTPASASRELLEDEDVREEVRARAAVLLRDADAHQPELGELPDQLGREAVLPVPGRRVRLDLRLPELARQRLDLPLVVAERELHRAASIRPVRGVHFDPCHRGRGGSGPGSRVGARGTPSTRRASTAPRWSATSRWSTRRGTSARSIRRST